MGVPFFTYKLHVQNDHYTANCKQCQSTQENISHAKQPLDVGFVLVLVIALYFSIFH